MAFSMSQLYFDSCWFLYLSIRKNSKEKEQKFLDWQTRLKAHGGWGPRPLACLPGWWGSNAFVCRRESERERAEDWWRGESVCGLNINSPPPRLTLQISITIPTCPFPLVYLSPSGDATTQLRHTGGHVSGGGMSWAFSCSFITSLLGMWWCDPDSVHWSWEGEANTMVFWLGEDFSSGGSMPGHFVCVCENQCTTVVAYIELQSYPTNPGTAVQCSSLLNGTRLH